MEKDPYMTVKNEPFVHEPRYKGVDSTGRPTEFPATTEGHEAMEKARQAFHDSQIIETDQLS